MDEATKGNEQEACLASVMLAKSVPSRAGVLTWPPAVSSVPAVGGRARETRPRKIREKSAKKTSKPRAFLSPRRVCHEVQFRQLSQVFCQLTQLGVVWTEAVTVAPWRSRQRERTVGAMRYGWTS